MYNVRCTSCKKQLETQCTNYKKFEKQMYKFGNNIYKCRGKCGNTMYKPKEIWKHDGQIQRKSRKNNHRFKENLETTSTDSKRLVQTLGTNFNGNLGGNNVKKGKEHLEKQLFSDVQCTMYNLQESLETQCTHKKNIWAEKQTYKWKERLETKCTNVKGHLEKHMYKFEGNFGNNMSKFEGSFENTI